MVRPAAHSLPTPSQPPIVDTGFPFLSTSKPLTSAVVHAALLRFDAALSPWWDVRRRALVVSLYAGLDAPEHGTQAHDFEHINSPLHYMRHELPTAPAADTSMQEYLLAGSMVRARQYERPANHADGSAVGFTHITRKTLSLEVDMPVAGLRGYLSTWSGYNTFLKDPATQLRDPLEVLCEEVAEALGDRADAVDAVHVSWPCALLLATKE